jgi:hypothetical protein
MEANCVGHDVVPFGARLRLHLRKRLKVCKGSSEEIATASEMSVVPFVSRHSVYFANVPRLDLPVNRSTSTPQFVGLSEHRRYVAWPLVGCR